MQVNTHIYDAEDLNFKCCKGFSGSKLGTCNNNSLHNNDFGSSKHYVHSHPQT